MKDKPLDPKIKKRIKKEAEKFIHQCWDKAYPFFNEAKLNEKN